MSNNKNISVNEALQSIAEELAIKNMFELSRYNIGIEEHETLMKAIKYHILSNARNIIKEAEEETNNREKIERVLK